MFADLAWPVLDLAWPTARLSVLAYHRVLPQKDPLLPSDPSAEEFEHTMEWVRDTFNVISLSEGVAGLKSGRLPRRALAITFDDGYANNATIAAPILARLGLHATFFIATGFLDGGRMFNDTVVEAVRAASGAKLDLTAIGLGCHRLETDDERRTAIAAILSSIKYQPVEQRVALSERVAECANPVPPRDLMMTSRQAAAIAGSGFDLGGHTVNHPILAGLHESDARREIEAGRRQVEELTGRPVGLFAYPNGSPGKDYTAETVRLVREAGFDGAVSASPGAARPGWDLFQIPRFTPWDRQPMRFAARMWNNAARVEPRLLSIGIATMPRTG
ncbi:MAG: polysaccharide deacetylase family protein [Burkholderiaceae bacterium]